MREILASAMSTPMISPKNIEEIAKETVTRDACKRKGKSFNIECSLQTVG
ncbi:hypothetical protein LJK88_25780 [Paenibacillus sp. P26]|nr:hypothetical protein LJK88_25780 [Paenibacillus sp. P26]